MGRHIVLNIVTFKTLRALMHIKGFNAQLGLQCTLRALMHNKGFNAHNL